MTPEYPRYLQMSRSGLVLMFCGPSGTGKTLMVNALAAHLEKRVLLDPRLRENWDGGAGDGVVYHFILFWAVIWLTWIMDDHAAQLGELQNALQPSQRTWDP